MTVSTRPFKLLLPLLLVFCVEQAFWEFFTSNPDSPQLQLYQWGVLGASLGTALWYWRRMEPVMSRALLVLVVYLLLLMLESYATHGKLMAYPHVFAKVLAPFVMYGAYGFYRQYGLPPMQTLVSILFFVLLLNLLVIHPEALSLRAFLDNDRGFSSSSALMLVLPTLLCVCWFLQRGSMLAMLMFFVGVAAIIFLQHRSVWITTLIALPIMLVLLRWRVPGVYFSPQRLTLLVLLPLAVVAVGGVATVLENPDVVRKFEDSYDDITKADKQGTGSWRIKQVESYQPLIAQRPLLGWRLEGFEVPMQFYDPASDMPMWPDGTGHHFHSFYLDRMFYFGWLGILLVVTVPCMQVIRRLTHPAPLTAEAAALMSLLVGCLVFALSYDWPTYLYALFGLMLVAIERPPLELAAAPQVQQQAPAPELVLAT